MEAGTHEGPDTVVTVTGELDHDSGSWLSARSDRLVARANHSTVLDVGGVSFIDASGLRALTSFVHQLEAGGRRVALRSPSPALVRLLGLLDMRDRFAVAAELSGR